MMPPIVTSSSAWGDLCRLSHHTVPVVCLLVGVALGAVITWSLCSRRIMLQSVIIEAQRRRLSWLIARGSPRS